MKLNLMKAAVYAVCTSILSSNAMYALDGEPADCAEIETVQRLPAALSDLPITGIDCVRAIIARSSSQELEALFERVSEDFTHWRLVDIPPPLHGSIRIFSINYEQDYNWVLSFWRNEQTHSVSIRAFYNTPEEAAEDKQNPFRPEFIASNADAAAFLRARFGQSDQAITAALEAAGATSRPPHVIGADKWITYEIGSPDEITNLLTMGDKKMFYLKYHYNEFVGVYSKP